MTTSSENLLLNGEKEISDAVKDQFVNGTNTFSTAATGSGVKTALRWREQCLLATSVKKIIDELGNAYQKPWRYVTSFSTNKDDSANPADFMNRL